jgi:hypothetical protein
MMEKQYSSFNTKLTALSRPRAAGPNRLGGCGHGGGDRDPAVRVSVFRAAAAQAARAGDAGRPAAAAGAAERALRAGKPQRLIRSLTQAEAGPGR